MHFCGLHRGVGHADHRAGRHLDIEPETRSTGIPDVHAAVVVNFLSDWNLGRREIKELFIHFRLLVTRGFAIQFGEKMKTGAGLE